ncbi:DUF6318 family protein [Nocardioides iriomotensis]|uniref:DUF6318 family protein n=1 Tax=Nocardioides iriomotensis TaxID=715784 RepID=UPI003B830D8B
MRASRWRRSLVAVAAAGLLGFGTSACTSGDDPPKPAPLPTESPSPTGSSSEAPPSLPADAGGSSTRAAKAFARHFVDLVNYASATGDVEAINAVASDSCRVCRGMADGIQDVYSKGGHLEGDGWRVLGTKVLSGGRENERAISLTLLVSSQRRYEKPNSEPIVSDEIRGILDIYMRSTENSWTISRLVQS